MKKKTSYLPVPEVFFVLHRSQLWERPKINTLVLCPDAAIDGDYPPGTTVMARFNSAGIEEFETPMRIRFIDEKKSPVELLVGLIRTTEEGVLRWDQAPAFYIMLPDMGSYRLWVAALGSDYAIRLLERLNDVVACGRLRRRPEWLIKVTASEDFWETFITSTTMFFTFKNAAAVLTEQEFKARSRISQNLSLRFRLPTFANEHRIHLRFSEGPVLAKRMVVIIGKNGAGKSRTLFNLVASLLKGDSRVIDLQSREPLLNRIVAVATPGETNRSFPKAGKSGRLPYFKIALDSKRRSRNAFGNVLLQLMVSRERLGPMSRRELFLRTVGKVLPVNEVCLPWRSGHRRDSIGAVRPVSLAEFLSEDGAPGIQEWRNLDFEAAPVRWQGARACPLSSGQLTFLHFSAQACLLIEHGTLLLVDEPETHLHPNLIRDFMALAETLLAETKSIAVFATHSAYLVREVPTSQIVLLEETEPRRIEQREVRLKTLGADIGAISHFVFSDNLHGHLLQTILERAKASSRQPKEVLRQLESELSLEAYLYLQRKLEGK